MTTQSDRTDEVQNIPRIDENARVDLDQHDPNQPCNSRSIPGPDSGYFSPSTSCFDFEEQLSINCERDQEQEASDSIDFHPTQSFSGMSSPQSESSSVSLLFSSNPPTPNLPLCLAAGKIYQRRQSLSFPQHITAQLRTCLSGAAYEELERASSAPASISVAKHKTVVEQRTACTQTEGCHMDSNTAQASQADQEITGEENSSVATVLPLYHPRLAEEVATPEVGERPEPEGQEEDYVTADEEGAGPSDAMAPSDEYVRRGIADYRANLAYARGSRAPLEPNVIPEASAGIGAALGRMGDAFQRTHQNAYEWQGAEWQFVENRLEVRPPRRAFLGGLINVGFIVAFDGDVALRMIPQPILRAFQWIWGFALIRQIFARIFNN